MDATMNPLEYQPLIHFAARKWIKSFDKASVGIEYSDLVQEAFIVFIQAAKKYDETKGWAFSTYFVTAASHHFHNMLSRLVLERAQSVEVGYDLSLLDLIEDPSENPELELEGSQRIEAAIESPSPVAKMIAVSLINPSPELKSEFQALDSKRKIASSLRIDERYPPELNINFMVSLLSAAGISSKELSQAKEEIRQLELANAV